jgi:hypothetical protein
MYDINTQIPTLHDNDTQDDTSEYFTDFDLQWFRGGVKVHSVTHIITSSDIIAQSTTL